MQLTALIAPAKTSWHKLYCHFVPGSNRSGSCTKYLMVPNARVLPFVSFFCKADELNHKAVHPDLKHFFN